MAKYIINVPDEIIEFMDGKFDVFIEPEVKVGECRHYKVRLDDTEVTPYTEPDAVKNNKVNLCDSCNYIYPECPSERYDVMFGDGIGKDNICCCAGYRAINEQEIRQKVENEVWEFAKKVRLEGFIDSNGALRGYISNFETYQEAKAKYESWKAGIRVGYEVQHKELPELKIYVTDMDDNSFGGFALCRVEDVCDYGDRFSECNVHQYERTGRVFPNIVELLKKMGEEE